MNSLQQQPQFPQNVLPQDLTRGQDLIIIKSMKMNRKFGWLGILAVVSLLINIFLTLRIYPLSLFVKSERTEMQVSKVLDGDTFDTAEGERIRLFEIDAPEYPRDCMGTESKERLNTLISDKKISIEKHGKDNFGRILAIAYLDDLSINKLMVEEGMAYYRKDKVLTETAVSLERAEQTAKKTTRGIWSSQCQTQKKGCDIKGNYRSADTTRIYHTPDCYNYDKITIKDGTSDRWFCSEAEAIAQGFRKSKDCPK